MPVPFGSLLPEDILNYCILEQQHLFSTGNIVSCHVYLKHNSSNAIQYYLPLIHFNRGGRGMGILLMLRHFVKIIIFECHKGFGMTQNM